MAFENVDVNSLKKALISCKNVINYSESEQIINSISSPNIWQSRSQKKLKSAISTLIETRYKELTKNIDKYLETVNYIEQYQKLKTQNETLQKDYNSYSTRLYKDEQKTVTKKDIDGNMITETRTERVKDYSVQAKMTETKIRMTNNNLAMDNLRSKISNMV